MSLADRPTRNFYYILKLAKCGFSPQLLVITTIRDRNPRSHHKGATGRVRTGDQLYPGMIPVLCHCELRHPYY